MIVGEPSEMRVVTGQKGSWGFRAQVRGHEVHSSLIHTGVSAVMEAAGLIDWMAGLMAESGPHRAAERLRPALHHASTSALISGGTANNITARDCTFSGEVRCLPGRDRRRLARAASSPRPRAGRPRLRARPPRRRDRLSTTRMSLPGFLADRRRRGAGPRADRRQRPPASSATRPRPATSRRAASRR